MIPLCYFLVYAKLLRAIDEKISRNVAERKGLLQEASATQDLLSLFYEYTQDTQQEIIDFRRDLKAVQEELTNEGRNAFVPNDMSLGFKAFTPQYEGALSQSDYAMRIILTDSSRDTPYPPEAYTYFLQAKLAKPVEGKQDGPIWDSRSSFDETTGQQRKITLLREYLGNNLLYNLYCPDYALYRNSLTHFDRIEEIKSCIYNGKGGGITEYIDDMTNVAGMWLSHHLPKNLEALFSSPNDTYMPWSTFVLSHFFKDSVREYLPYNPDGIGLEEYRTRARQLYDRDDTAIAEAYEAIYGEGRLSALREDFSVPRAGIPENRVYTLEINCAFPRREYENHLEQTKGMGLGR